MTSQRRTLTLVVMCVGMFLVLLDVTVVNVALPRLRADLGAGVGSLQWIVDGYAVALASLMLPCGDLGDRHGHKRVVLAGLAAFGAGSLAAGLAPGAGAARRRARGAGRGRRAPAARHAGGHLARVPGRGPAGAGHRHLGRDLVPGAAGRGHRRRRPGRRPGLALGLPRQPPARRGRAARHGARGGRVARDRRPRARPPGCRPHGGAAGHGDLRDHRGLARGRRGGDRAPGGPGGGRAPAFGPDASRRPCSAGRPSPPPTPSAPR